MEEIRDYARECGIRCRQIRMSKGMSQQELAEKMNVTSQAISKWEKGGISDINHIVKLSDALGQDITSDQFDQDAVVSEVGKEILRILIDKGGYVDFSEFEQNMYGMKKDRISNELFKLERIGAVVREQFKDFAEKERDGIFITAKGVITFKNAVLIYNAELLRKVKTWDQRIDVGFTSFQEIVNADTITGLLMRMRQPSNGFRFDYISYLYKNFFSPVIPHSSEKEILYFDSDIQKIALGKDCYTDILSRMMQKTSRKHIDSEMDCVFDYTFVNDYDIEHFNNEYDQEMYYAWKSKTGLDEISYFALEYIIDKIRKIPAESIISCSEIIEASDKSNSDSDATLSLIQNGMFSNDISEEEKNMREFYCSLDDDKKENIGLWFTEGEIRKYVEENILPAKKDFEEKKVDETLHKIWELDKRTLSYYYSFPETWEENGLAQLIRDRVGVPKYEEIFD